MLILGLEASAKAASVALCRDGALVSQSFQLSGLTHSATLLPMAEALLKSTETAIAELDAIAVSRGPGSFTGVRIGVSTVKGLCWGAEKPAIGVSTLAAMAWNGVFAGEGALICCCMDARRNQVYNALFEIKDGRPSRLVPDRALAVEELGRELNELGREPYFVGDGAELCHKALGGRLAPEPMRHQCAWGVCMEAMDKPPEDAALLLPVYLRLSQAERERQARLAAEK